MGTSLKSHLSLEQSGFYVFVKVFGSVCGRKAKPSHCSMTWICCCPWLNSNFSFQWCLGTANMYAGVCQGLWFHPHYSIPDSRCRYHCKPLQGVPSANAKEHQRDDGFQRAVHLAPGKSGLFLHLCIKSKIIHFSAF